MSPADTFRPSDLHVVVLGNFPYPEGMATTQRVQLFVDALIADGSSVEVLLLRQSDVDQKEVTTRGVHRDATYRTVGSTVELGPRLLFAAPAFLREGLRALRATKRDDRINVLYVVDVLGPENVIFVAFARTMGFRILFDILEDYSVLDEKRIHAFTRLKLLIMRALDRAHVFVADGLMAVSTTLVAKYEARNRRQIPIRLITVAARENRQETWHRNRIPQILYAGSFAAKDGVELLMEAVAQLRATGTPCRLIMTGEGPNLDGRLTTLGTAASVEFVGKLRRDQYLSCLREADILCVPRLDTDFAARGFPFKLGEYLATAKPVVVSDVGDVRLYLEHGRSALIVPPADIEALSKALVSLIAEPAKARRIGDGGFEIWRQHFSDRVTYAQLKSLLQEIC